MGPLSIEIIDSSEVESVPSHQKVERHRGCPTRVRTLRTLSELHEFREIWDLWCDDPYSDMDFYLTSARCRVGFVRPHVLVMYRDKIPDCMLIGRLEQRHVQLKVGYKTICEPMVKQLSFLRGGLLGNASTENCQLLARELKRSMRREEADCVELTGMTKNSNLSKATSAEFNYLFQGHFVLFQERWWFNLPNSYQGFQQGMARKYRHEFRRHQRKLANDFPENAYIRRYCCEEEVDELVRRVEIVSTKTYQRALKVGFRPDTEVLEFLRSAARREGLRGYVLHLNNVPCAYFIGNKYRNTFYGDFIGFDPYFGKYSPGLLVLMRGIEECFDSTSRVTRFDLGLGDRAYKRMICNHSQQDGSQYLYAFSWTGLKLNLLRSSLCLLDLVARKLISKSGLLQQLKNAWQHGLCSRSSGEIRTSSECNVRKAGI